jgi:hypothetical protein
MIASILHRTIASILHRMIANILHRMIASIPYLQSALNFFLTPTLRNQN